jgi:hypothetical protein
MVNFRQDKIKEYDTRRKMVYVEEWDSFLQRAQAMATAAPETTRLLVKYRHVDGTFTVKVTDNVQVCYTARGASLHRFIRERPHFSLHVYR